MPKHGTPSEFGDLTITFTVDFPQKVDAELAHKFEEGAHATLGDAHGVVALNGLAPYWFEVDASAFLSEKGDVTARIEAEYELLLTQRLILVKSLVLLAIEAVVICTMLDFDRSFTNLFSRHEVVHARAQRVYIIAVPPTMFQQLRKIGGLDVQHHV